MNAMVKKNFLFLLLGAMFLLSACALPGIPPNPSNPMYSVAVLPFYNATNDVDGPQMVREMTEKKLARWNDRSAPLSEVDKLLRDKMGVTLGAQLEMTTPQKLGETLGVDGVLYGYLLNFEQITTGLYNVKKVRGGVRLVDTKTGKTVWAKGQGVSPSLRAAASSEAPWRAWGCSGCAGGHRAFQVNTGHERYGTSTTGTRWRPSRSLTY